MTYCVLFLPGQLPWCLEVDTKIGEFPFVVLTRVLDRIDVKGNREPMDRQDYCLSFAVDKSLLYRDQWF